MNKSVSLYEISKDYLTALDVFTDPEVDLPIEAVNDTLEGIEGSMKDKAINVVQYMRNLESTAAAIKEAEAKMRTRRQYIENRANALKQYVYDNMSATGVTKIECPYFKLAIQKNPVSVRVDSKKLSPVFTVVTVEMPGQEFERLQDQFNTHTVKDIKPIKANIKDALQSGVDVPGAELVNGTRLAIRGG